MLNRYNLIRWRVKRCLNLFYFSKIRKKIPNKAVQKGVLFIHIPKAAGMSICKALYGGQIGHKRAIDFYRADKVTYKKLKTFTIVRDPYSRLCSAYNFLMQGGMDDYYYDRKFGEFIRTFESFESFVFDWLAKGNNIYKYMHFIPQIDFISIDGVLSVDKIGKVEELSEFIHELNCNWDLGLNEVYENKSNSTFIKRSEIMNNDILRDKIFDIYECDFTALGYKKNN